MKKIVTTETIKVLQKRVKSGIRWLNKVKPNWYKGIDVEELALDNLCTCVCGQVFGDYMKVLIEDYWNDGEAKEGDEFSMTDKQMVQRGFNVDGHDYETLTRIWYLEISKIQEK